MNPYVAGIAATGVILAAVYLLWMYERVMFGPVKNEKNRGLRDLSTREFWTLAPVILLILWIGIFPNPFLRRLDTASAALMERVNARVMASDTIQAGAATTPLAEAHGRAFEAAAPEAVPPADVR
jgi:NADH-quinone oxidoreductase subunit M